MNTERTPYKAEDDEGDDSSAVSYGSGPAFRPVPRIPLEKAPAPPPSPRQETVPRFAGVLFDRAAAEQAAKASSEESEKKKSEDKKKAAAASGQAITALPPAVPRIPAPRAPAESLLPLSSVQESELEEEPKHELLGHLPDIGEYTPDLPEPAPVRLGEQPAVEHAATPMAEARPDGARYPVETVEDIPEWPDKAETSDEPAASPVPPRREPNYAQTSAFETPAASDDESLNRVPPAAAAGGGGGGGGLPPVPPRPAGGLGQPGGPGNSGNQGNLPPQHKYNAFNSSGGGGSASPNVIASNPNATPASRPFETAPVIINKKGSMWPYVAVLAENIARKRADRKLKKELGSRIDKQTQAQEATNANQVRLERQQRDMIDQQRRQAIRDAHRPSGPEWGVPRYPAGESARVVPGQRVAGPGERPAVAARPGEAVPAVSVPGQEQQPADMVDQELEPHQRVEHSAWHSIVVNEKGHEVAGAMQYGEGFQRERQQEIIRDHTGDSVAAGAAGAAGAAYAMGAGSSSSGGRSGHSPSGSGQSYYGAGGQQNYQQSLPSGMTSPGLPTGAPIHADPQHQLPEHARKTSAAPGPLFWMMIALIIVAFFVAAFI